MTKRKKKRGQRIGSTRITHRKIRGQRRKVYVIRKSRSKTLVRLVNPRKNKAGRKYNYNNRGGGWSKDQKGYNKREYWERKYRRKKRR